MPHTHTHTHILYYPYILSYVQYSGTDCYFVDSGNTKTSREEIIENEKDVHYKVVFNHNGEGLGP